MSIEIIGMSTKGSRKNFENDFTVNPVFVIKPFQNKKLRLLQIRHAYRIGTTEDRSWVFEIAINSSTTRTIVNQKYYKDYTQLIAQSNIPPQQIDGVLYMTFVFPSVSDPDYAPMELLSSMDMELKIYTTNDAQHSGLPYSPYTANTSAIGGTSPVAYTVLEAVSLDE